MSIRSLEEFILRRLDHKDAGAVAAGYRFYGKTLEENFSLQSSLKELLLEYQNRETSGKVPERYPQNTVGLHYTKSRKLSIRREERIGMFRKKISFRSGKEMREKTTAEKLKKKVQ